VNRPSLGNNTNIGGNVMNRPNIGNNTKIGNNVVNRPSIGNNVNLGGGNTVNVNRPNSGNSINVNNRRGGINNSGNLTINNVNNNFNASRPAWTNGNPSWAYRPGWDYHRGWINGYWHGQNNGNWWNNGGAFWTGMAIGGIGAWGIGSSIYNWGYMPYVNPYAAAAPVVVAQPTVIQQPVVVQQPVPAQATVSATPPVDYSQPLATSTPPPDPAVADPAIQTFDAARAAFKSGNYAEALRETDQAIKSLPNDAALHEFRALCLFALKQYDQAAGTLYAVLSAGPGWDWTTLSSLYPGIDTYTAQLRALEDYVGEQPSSASARFVLAYHYLTQGHTEAAVDQLKQVVQLQPSDKLSAQIVAQLSGESGKAQPTPSEAQPAAPTEPASSPPIQQGNLVGTWKASPGAGSTIELIVTTDGNFKWNVIDQGKSQPIEGKYTYGNGILALSQDENNALVGKVTWQDVNHFRFQAMGGPGDPGLLFSPAASN
jgi:tetratricopeptide (TPR) repeat protein